LIGSHRKTESNVILQILLQSRNATLIEGNQWNKCRIFKRHHGAQRLWTKQ